MKKSILIQNDSVKKVLIDHARKNGYTVCNNFESGGEGRWKYFVFDPSPRDGIHVYATGFASEQAVELHEMIEILADVNKNPELKLTDEYTAVVFRKEGIVKVGCQSVPFEKVNELKALIDKHS